MSKCRSCYWYGHCETEKEDCEYYDPMEYYEDYEQDLRMREEEYKDYIQEMNS